MSRTTAELHIASRKRLNVGALLTQRLYSDHIDRAYENGPCERKLHRVIFLLISLVPNALSHFRKWQKKPIKCCSSDEDFAAVV